MTTTQMDMFIAQHTYGDAEILRIDVPESDFGELRDDIEERYARAGFYPADGKLVHRGAEIRQSDSDHFQIHLRGGGR